MRRPSPALVISVIALVGAWGGPALADALIGSADVEDRSLQGRDIASSTITSRNITALKGSDIIPDSLDGSDIREDTLNIPKVDTAKKADSVRGVRIERFSYADPKGESAIFYEGAGIRVTGFCNSGSLQATVEAMADDGIIRNEIATPTQPPIVQADDDFDTGEQFPLLPDGINDISADLTFYEPDGDTLLVKYLAASNLPASTGHQCLIAGVAIRADM